MVKKKQVHEKEHKTKEGKAKDFRIEMSQTVDDVKTFIEKFKSDVSKKKEKYKLYAQNLRKRKS